MSLIVEKAKSETKIPKKAGHVWEWGRREGKGGRKGEGEVGLEVGLGGLHGVGNLGGRARRNGWKKWWMKLGGWMRLRGGGGISE